MSTIIKKIADLVLEGNVIEENGCSILINSNDNVEVWDRSGEGKEASLLFLEKAVEEFCKIAELSMEEKEEMSAPTEVNQSVVPDGEKSSADIETSKEQNKDSLPDNKQEETLYEGIGDGTNPMPEFNSMAKGEKAAKLVYIYEKAGNKTTVREAQVMDVGSGEYGAPGNFGMVTDESGQEHVVQYYNKKGELFGTSDFLGTVFTDKTSGRIFEVNDDLTYYFYSEVDSELGPSTQRAAKLVDTFDNQEHPYEEYRSLISKEFHTDLLKDIADPDMWEMRHVSKDLPSWSKVVDQMKAEESDKEASKTAGPRIKENWGDYSRDLEAESAEDLYRLVRSLGQEGPYDWNSQPGQTNVGDPAMQDPGQSMQNTPKDTMIPSGIQAGGLPGSSPDTGPPPPATIFPVPGTGLFGVGQTAGTPPVSPVVAVDEAAKKYYKDYYGEDFGGQLTKGDVADKRKEKKKEKKDAQAMPPKNPKDPGGDPSGAPAPGGAPGQAPGGAPKAPGGMPGQAPGATPPVMDKAPGALDPGTGQQGLETLGWTSEDLNLMDEDSKKKILQFKINKPGTKPQAPPGGQPPAGAPAPGGMPGQAPGAPAAPGGAPAAPGGAPAAPGGAPGQLPPPGPKARLMAREIEKKILMRKIQQVLDPSQAPAPQQQAPMAPEIKQAPPQEVDNDFTGSSLDESALGIFEEVRASQIQTTDADMLPLEKMQMFAKRLSTELGMSVDEFVERLGINKQQLQNYFK